MKIVLVNTESFREHSPSADIAVVVFTRMEVELQQVNDAVDRLRALSEDGEKVRRFAGKTILLFEGYDADPRNLREIPACVSFFREVDRQWSYWLHFLVPSADMINLALLMLFSEWI